jgi:MFS family permease
MQRHFGLIRNDPTLRLLTLCALLHGMFASAVSIYQSLVAVTVFGITDQIYATILLVAMAVAVGASIGVGIVTDQRPSRRLMALMACTMVTLGTLLYAMFLALLPVLAATPMVWLLMSPAGAGGAMMYALVIGYLQDLLGARAGAGASLIAIQQLVSQTLAAAVFAIGTWIYGYALVSVLGAVAIIAATLALHWLDRGRAD